MCVYMLFVYDDEKRSYEKERNNRKIIDYCSTGSWYSAGPCNKEVYVYIYAYHTGIWR